MTHRTERGNRPQARRWVPWVVLALAVVFLTRGFDHAIRIDGMASLIPLIVIAAVGYFLWTWWNGDDEAQDGEGSTRAAVIAATAVTITPNGCCGNASPTARLTKTSTWPGNPSWKTDRPPNSIC